MWFLRLDTCLGYEVKCEAGNIESPPENLNSSSEQWLAAGPRELRHGLYVVVDKGASSWLCALREWSRGAGRQDMSHREWRYGVR